jgi:hypothetical protein
MSTNVGSVAKGKIKITMPDKTPPKRIAGPLPFLSLNAPAGNSTTDWAYPAIATISP